jgi:Tol biopolymer transport system component/enterochelin esterase-like enzyme
LGSGGGVIAFDSERDGNPELYVMNADGSDQRRLTEHKFGDYMGDWSPDGSQIVFHSSRDRNEELYILDLKCAGSGSARCTRRLTEDPAIDMEPAWSSDGNRIVWEKRILREGDAELAVLDLETRTTQRLTDNNISDFQPDWSTAGAAGGEQILFSALLEDNRANLIVINPDGTGRTRLTWTEQHDWFPKWSPDGRMIAFASDRDGDEEIFVMNSDGSSHRQLTFNEAVVDTRPRWSPDGTRIAFESDRDGDFEIYVIELEGAMQDPTGYVPQQLTINDTDDRRAVWKPDVSMDSEASEGAAVSPGELLQLRSTFELYSEKVDDLYRIYVGLPEGYDPARPAGYHVIYLLDGDWYFDGSSWMIDDGGVVGIAGMLSEGGRIPESIVIGIGYPDRNQRGRDFHWQLENFHAFLTEELTPYFDTEYNTNPDAPRTLIGHSSGGYFTLYSFFQFDGQGGNPFEKFVVISGDYSKMGFFLFDEEARMSRRIEEGGVLGGALYMAVGGMDEARFVNSHQDMTNKLESRGYQDFYFKSRVYISDDHSSIVTPAVWAGLLWVFGE